nr:dienelactone hydrolase family protein [Streptomyces dangxiongensis]
MRHAAKHAAHPRDPARAVQETRPPAPHRPAGGSRGAARWHHGARRAVPLGSRSAPGRAARRRATASRRSRGRHARPLRGRDRGPPGPGLPAARPGRLGGGGPSRPAGPQRHAGRHGARRCPDGRGRGRRGLAPTPGRRRRPSPARHRRPSRVRPAGTPGAAARRKPDDFAPPERVAALHRTARKRGVDLEVFRYPGVGHFHTEPALPDHDPATTELTWRRVLDFLDLRPTL